MKREEKKEKEGVKRKSSSIWLVLRNFPPPPGLQPLPFPCTLTIWNSLHTLVLHTCDAAAHTIICASSPALTALMKLHSAHPGLCWATWKSFLKHDSYRIIVITLFTVVVEFYEHLYCVRHQPATVGNSNYKNNPQHILILIFIHEQSTYTQGDYWGSRGDSTFKKPSLNPIEF